MNKAEREHLSKLVQLGCIVCRNLGYRDSPAEVHHIRAGKGVGQRSGHFDTLPLCPGHHRTGGHGTAIHAGQKTWEAKFGTETKLLGQVQRMLKSI